MRESIQKTGWVRQFAIVACSMPLIGQVVHVGSQELNRCNKAEHILPNLTLKRSVHVSGNVTDGHAALQNSKVELRKYVSARKQISLKFVITDELGNFDLGVIQPAQYRLLNFCTPI